jgi:hypothetical protein
VKEIALDFAMEAPGYMIFHHGACQTGSYLDELTFLSPEVII